MKFARIVSVIANPVFILAGLPYFLVWSHTGDLLVALKWTFYTWVYLLVFGVFVLAGIKGGLFSDIDVSRREQRPLLYYAGFLLSGVYFVLLIILNAPVILFIAIIGIILGIFLGSIMNNWVKVSVHVTAMTALLTGLSMVYKNNIVLLLLLIPLICWARVKIKRHSIREVVSGVFLGTLLSLIMYVASRDYIAL